MYMCKFVESFEFHLLIACLKFDCNIKLLEGIMCAGFFFCLPYLSFLEAMQTLVQNSSSSLQVHSFLQDLLCTTPSCGVSNIYSTVVSGLQADFDLWGNTVGVLWLCAWSRRYMCCSDYWMLIVHLLKSFSPSEKTCSDSCSMYIYILYLHVVIFYCIYVHPDVRLLLTWELWYLGAVLFFCALVWLQIPPLILCMLTVDQGLWGTQCTGSLAWAIL